MPDGTLNLLLVIVNPDALTPYDPESTDVPGEEHHYWTSNPRDHCWIAQQGEGPNARPDVSIGGQRLELPLGRAIDGECQVRVIDEPAPTPSIVCDIESLVDEGDAGLDQNYLTTGGWTATENVTGLTAPGWWQNTVTEPFVAGFILFGSGTWDGYIEKTFNGTESGGPAWTPGQRVAARFRVTWSLQGGPGQIYAELEGALDPVTGQTVNRIEPPFSGGDFWNIDSILNAAVFNGVLSGVADASGEIKVRLGGEGYGGSTNLNCSFTDLQFVSCEEQLVEGDPSQLYTTGSLADEAARQKQLGRPYYLKASTDGGVTFDEMVYAGFTKQITMERSKTFLLTGGDAGRGRRVSRAWSNLNPVEDFVP